MSPRRKTSVIFYFSLLACAFFGTAAAFPSIASANDVNLVLRLQERVSMEELARAVLDPRSPRYQKYYTPEEIREIAGPTDYDYDRIVEAVQAKGFNTVSVDKTHLFLTVSASQDTVERTFGTRLEYVDGARTRHALIQDAVLPKEWAGVASVIGLDNTRQSRNQHIVQPSSHDIGDGFSPSEIKSMYGFNAIYQGGVSGKNQDIAIGTYDDINYDDPKQYWQMEGIKPAPALDHVYFNGTPKYNEDSAMETELDVEFSGMIAPGAKIHVFPSATNDDPGEVQIFTAILDDNRAKVANYSWGDCEADVTAQHASDMNQVFARAVAQGVNIDIAAGDWGSYGCPQSTKTTPGAVNADWPAANPYVVSVGGTSVNGTSSSGDAQEVAWTSTGGGVSVLFERPDWQSGFQAPYLKRSFPDVAFNADPYTGESAYVHQNGTATWIEIGGTSIAAPQWTGFLALVGEGRASKGALGFLNPIVYGMSAAQRGQAFHDITSGSNGAYSAGPGWDATTGWGSPRAEGLYQLLVSH